MSGSFGPLPALVSFDTGLRTADETAYESRAVLLRYCGYRFRAAPSVGQSWFYSNNVRDVYYITFSAADRMSERVWKNTVD